MGDQVEREYVDVNGDGLADVRVQTAWDLQVYLSPHSPGAAQSLRVEYPSCDWVGTAWPLSGAKLGADSDGSGPDELYVQDRWGDGNCDYPRLGFFLPVTATGVVDADAPGAGALVGQLTGGGGTGWPLFDLDGDGTLQWSLPVLGAGAGLAVTNGPAVALDTVPSDPALLAGTILGDSILVAEVVADGSGGDDLIVTWKLNRSENTAVFRVADLTGDLDAMSAVHYALEGQWYTKGVADYLGLGHPQMIISAAGTPLLIADLP